MSEKRLAKKFQTEWKKQGNPYFKRLEPKACSEGIPDCWLVNKRRTDIFVELKYLPKKFKARKLPIKLSQIHWFLKYPGTPYFLFQVENEYFMFRQYTAEKYGNSKNLPVGQITNVILELKDKITWERFNELTCKKFTNLKDICACLQG